MAVVGASVLGVECLQDPGPGGGMHRRGLLQGAQAVCLLGGGPAGRIGRVEVGKPGADRRQRLARGRGRSGRLAGNAHLVSLLIAGLG